MHQWKRSRTESETVLLLSNSGLISSNWLPIQHNWKVSCYYPIILYTYQLWQLIFEHLYSQQGNCLNYIYSNLLILKHRRFYNQWQYVTKSHLSFVDGTRKNLNSRHMTILRLYYSKRHSFSLFWKAFIIKCQTQLIL